MVSLFHLLSSRAIVEAERVPLMNIEMERRCQDSNPGQVSRVLFHQRRWKEVLVPTQVPCGIDRAWDISRTRLSSHSDLQNTPRDRCDVQRVFFMSIGVIHPKVSCFPTLSVLTSILFVTESTPNFTVYPVYQTVRAIEYIYSRENSANLLSKIQQAFKFEINAHHRVNNKVPRCMPSRCWLKFSKAKKNTKISLIAPTVRPGFSSLRYPEGRPTTSTTMSAFAHPVLAVQPSV